MCRTVERNKVNHFEICGVVAILIPSFEYLHYSAEWNLKYCYSIGSSRQLHSMLNCSSENQLLMFAFSFACFLWHSWHSWRNEIGVLFINTMYVFFLAKIITKSWNNLNTPHSMINNSSIRFFRSDQQTIVTYFSPLISFFWNLVKYLVYWAHVCPFCIKLLAI